MDESYNILIPIIKRICVLERRSVRENSSFLYGSGKPIAAIGGIGDVYMDTSTATLYTKNNKNQWDSSMPISISSIDGGVF